MSAVANRQTGWLNADLFGCGSQSCYTLHLQGRRKAGDWPDDLACARLIHDGVILLAGRPAVERFEELQKERGTGL